MTKSISLPVSLLAATFLPLANAVDTLTLSHHDINLNKPVVTKSAVSLRLAGQEPVLLQRLSQTLVSSLSGY
jgi:hypothetical protein